jgi:hypothetical protein
VVINNNPVSSIINNNYSESDDVAFNLSLDDEDTIDTEEILVSEKKDYKVEPVKDKRKTIEIVNKTNSRNSKIAKVFVDDADEDGDRNDISDKMSVYSRRVINNGVSDIDTTSVNSIRTANLSVFSAKMRERKISVQNKTNYYPDENYFSIYANGFNDNIYIYVDGSEKF